MTIEITKALASMQDLALGVGQVTQLRGGANVSVDKINFAYSFNSVANFIAATGLSKQSGETAITGGTLWKLSGAGYLDVGGGLYADPLTAIDLGDYGVVGDYDKIANTGTNNTATINNAIANGGDFKLPLGNYLLGGSILPNSNTKISFEDRAVLYPTSSSLIDMIKIEGIGPDNGSFVALDVNASKVATQLTSTALTGVAKGDYVEIRSNKLISGNNNKASKQAVMRKIVNIVGDTYYFNKPLDYDFNTADTAEVAKVPLVKQNITINASNLNDEDFEYLMSRGIVIKYCDNVTIVEPKVYGSKAKNSIDIEGRVGIVVNASHNVKIISPEVKHCGWYGVAVSGFSEDIYIVDLVGEDNRHTFDITHAASSNLFAGEPNGVYIIRPRSRNDNASGISTHDTGKHIVFLNPVSVGAGKDSTTNGYGYYIRNKETQLINPEAYYASLDGIKFEAGAYGCIVKNGITNYNGVALLQDGVNATGEYVKIDGLHAEGNGSAGIHVREGKFNNITCLNNVYAFRCLGGGDETIEITNSYAPQSAIQTVCYRCETNPAGSNFKPKEKLYLRNNTTVGYADFLFSISSASTEKHWPNTDGSNIIFASTTSADKTTDELTLSAGTATLNTTSVRSYHPSLGTTRGSVLSNVRINPITAAANEAFTPAIVDGTSVTITSTNPASTANVRISIGW